jgi:hypothetical protein
LAPAVIVIPARLARVTVPFVADRWTLSVPEPSSVTVIALWFALENTSVVSSFVFRGVPVSKLATWASLTDAKVNREVPAVKFVPLPSPRKVNILPWLLSTTTRSACPSLLKSPTASADPAEMPLTTFS